MQRGWVGYVFASPWLVGFFGLMLVPMVASLLLSLCEWKGIDIRQIKWVGLEHYRQIGSDLASDPDSDARIALYNTAYYSFLAVPLGLAFSLFLAVLLNQKIKGISFFRTIFYMPHVVGGVATIMMWMWVFNPQFGILNAFLRSCSEGALWVVSGAAEGLAWIMEGVGLGAAATAWGLRDVSWHWEPPAWLYSDQWSKPALIIMALWGSGGAMLIFLAALQNVPEQLYEAARIDGAGRWQQFRHVTIPQISPAIFFNLVMGIIHSFQVFNAAYIMTDGTGGQGRSLLFYVLLIYNRAFRDFRMGEACALAWVLFAIILAFTLLVVRSSRAWVYYEGEDQ